MLSEDNAIKMAVSEKVGVVKSVYRIPIDVGDPKVHVAAAEMCDTRYLGSKLRHGRPGGGAALSEDEAVVAAVGEVIERYCAIVPQDRKIIFGSYNELVGDYPVVSPERFALFSELQYRTIPFVPFTKETRVSWCRGLSLITVDDHPNRATHDRVNGATQKRSFCGSGRV